MKREKLEKYLGKMVEVKICDGTTHKGCLRKSRDEMFKNDANLYIPVNWYFVTSNEASRECISCLFRTSHVETLKFVEVLNEVVTNRRHTCHENNFFEVGNAITLQDLA